MTCIKPTVICEPLIDVCEPKFINSNSTKIFDIDINTVTKESLDFSTEYQIKFNKNDKFSGLITWFDIIFDNLPNQVNFSTGPFTDSTHWKQVVFYCEKDIKVKKGDILSGSFAARKSKRNFRELDIKISFHLETQDSSIDTYQLYKIR